MFRLLTRFLEVQAHAADESSHCGACFVADEPHRVSRRTFRNQKGSNLMLILLLFILVLLVFGFGFAAHVLWIAAVIFFVFWLVGLLLGRGSSGRHNFYRW